MMQCSQPNYNVWLNYNHWCRNPFALGGGGGWGAGVTPVNMNILFAKVWGKKQVFMAKYGGLLPLQPPGSYAYDNYMHVHIGHANLHAQMKGTKLKYRPSAQ